MSGAGAAVDLLDARDGLLVPVRARPHGRRDAIVGVRAGALLVETSAPPAEGAANEAIRRVLAAALAVPRRDVTLTAGAASRQKRFRVAGLDVAAARSRLAPWLGEGDGASR